MCQHNSFVDGTVYVWNADTGEEEHVYERPLGVNNNKATTFVDVPIVNSLVYHPFDHIVAFSGIGKHPENGMPLAICIYKFEKNLKNGDNKESHDVTLPSLDTIASLKPPAFHDSKNQYKDKLSPISSKRLASKENINEDDGDIDITKDEKNSSGTLKSPEKIKSILYELDQYLLEKGHT